MLHNTHIPLKWCCIGTITGADPEKVEGVVKDVRAQSTRKDFANYYYFIYSLKSIKFNCNYAYADQREHTPQIRHALLSISHTLLSMRHTNFQKFSHTAWTKGGHEPPMTPINLPLNYGLLLIKY